jgi:D-hexose-6-phosphate mutarotase
MSNAETTLAGGLAGVTLSSAAGGTCEMYKHGAHVASWKTAAGDDIIFLSSEVR